MPIWRIPKFIEIIDDKKEIFSSPNGLNDLMDTKVKEKEIIPNRFIL